MIGNFIVAPISSIALKAKLMSTLVRFQKSDSGDSQDQKVAPHQPSCDDEDGQRKVLFSRLVRDS